MFLICLSIDCFGVLFLVYPYSQYIRKSLSNIKRAVVYKLALNEYRLAQKDYPKYVMKVKANREKEKVRIAKAQVAAEERRVREAAQREKEKAIIEAEYNAAVLSQHRQEPWAVRYSTSPCPRCGHYKVRHAKWEDKSMSIAFWGMASSTIGKNYKCEHCGRMW